MSQYNELWESYCTYYCSSAAKLAWPTVLAESHTSFSWFNELFSLMASWNVTLYSVEYSLDFSTEKHIPCHFTLWLMTLCFLLATCGLDHPFLLLPDLWLCSQHAGCNQCPRLSQHNSGLPPPAGKSFDVHKPLGALGEKSCARCTVCPVFPSNVFLLTSCAVLEKSSQSLLVCIQHPCKVTLLTYYNTCAELWSFTISSELSAPLHLEWDSYCNT